MVQVSQPRPRVLRVTVIRYNAECGTQTRLPHHPTLHLSLILISLSSFTFILVLHTLNLEAYLSLRFIHWTILSSLGDSHRVDPLAPFVTLEYKPTAAD